MQMRLQALSLQILILNGEDEDLLRPGHVQAMATAMPQAEFILIPGAGHYALLSTGSGFGEIVLDFLKDK